MRREDVESFLSRGYGQTRDDDYWRRLSPAEKLRLSEELRLAVRELRPDWDGDRTADLESHLRLIELLRRVEAKRKR